jgi:large subunit ribosomal protein L32
MPLPKRKHSKARRDKRRSHLALKSVGLSTCPQCNEVKLPHRACPNCGVYKGRKAIETEK